MKRLTILLLTMAVLACHKDRKIIDCGITGKWELRKSVGSIAGTITYPPGNGNVLEFKSDGTYSGSSNGTTTVTGTYEIQLSSTAGQWILKRTTSSGSSSTISIQVNSQELIFLSPIECCDYPDTFFEKI